MSERYGGWVACGVLAGALVLACRAPADPPLGGAPFVSDGGTPSNGGAADAGTEPFALSVTASCDGGCATLGFFGFDGTHGYFTSTWQTWRFSPVTGEGALLPANALNASVPQGS